MASVCLSLKPVRKIRNHPLRASSRSDRQTLSVPCPAVCSILCTSSTAGKDIRILEVGCGDGSFLLCCQQQGYHQVTAIDISPEQVEICHQKGFKDVICSDVFSYFDEHEDSFDCVVMSDVLEHLSKTEILETLKQIYQCLNPSGKLIVRVPNLSNPFNIKTQFGDFTHETGFTKSSLAQVFQVGGFKVETVHGEFSEHTNRWRHLWYDQILWNAFQIFLKNTLHLDTEAVRGKNLIAVGIKETSDPD
ncbi:MAG: class I SAM-dependent methyltransferase [Leptolyngbyaceae cyanobacterium SM1_1_3]|nr:class I SAM-dependent methyltransferase [Leptolyngbyaceae cyanobacterium SM1_1_3]